MNQVSLLLNLALSIAVATLFYLHFAPAEQSDSSVITEPSANVSASSSIPSGGIAYVNSDTIWAKYNLILDLQATLEEEQRRQESYLTSKGRKLEEDAMNFQQRASQMTEPQLILAQNELQQQQVDLQNRQQELLLEQQRIEQQLYDKQQEMGLQIREELTAQLKEYSTKNGFQIIIAGAGGAAHLPGMVASKTTLPVLGVPVPSKHLEGHDSLLSIVQMPKGIPVATFAIGESGSHNAGLFAVSLIALNNKKINQKLKDFRKKQVTKVLNMKINEK